MHENNNPESPVTKADFAEMMGGISNRFDSIDERFEAVLAEMRQGFGQAQHEREALREDLKAFKVETRESFSEVHTRLDALKEDVDAIAGDLVTRYATKTELRALDKRVTKLETKSA